MDGDQPRPCGWPMTETKTTKQIFYVQYIVHGDLLMKLVLLDDEVRFVETETTKKKRRKEIKNRTKKKKKCILFSSFSFFPHLNKKTDI
jgi:hypothetical protein